MELTPEQKAAFELRKQRALAQMDLCVDVLSAWRGRYEDDDKPAGIAWIVAVIPEEPGSDPRGGSLCIRGTARPGMGWRLKDGQFQLASLCHSLRGLGWPVTRRQFRAAASASGVDLPARHATIYLSEGGL